MNSDEDNCAGLLDTLSDLHADLPKQLRHDNQTLATLELPLSIISESDTVPDSRPAGLSGNRPMASPNLRHDFYTGEIFVERQSNFRLRVSDLGQPRAIRCVECEGFELDFDGLEVDETADGRQKFFLLCYACSEFTVRNLHARNGRNLGLFEDCTRFQIADLSCEAYEGYGLVILHSRNFDILRCRFKSNLAAGIMIVGDCRDGWITHCEFVESRGYYNWDAGLHLCHCSRRIVAAHVPELCHEPLPIRMKTMRPRRIRIRNNMFANNRAQGIYLEGARECLIDSNIIADNNKEGICLDWGTALCVIRENSISGNGYRSRMTATEIDIDFIKDFPLMPDESSTCKLPGLSIDNGGLNAIVHNKFLDNFGGGLKMVRSAVGNLVIDNLFSANNRGVNFFVKKIYDIFILSLGNRGGEFDQGATELLDFTASCFNRITRNRFATEDRAAIHGLQEYNYIHGNRFGTLGSPAQGHERPEVAQPDEPPDHHRKSRPQETEIDVSGDTLFSFGSATGKQHGVIRLNPSGSIDFPPHPNESYWRQEENRLLFFDSRFRVSTVFERYRTPDGSYTFLGRFRNSSVLHYLVPLLSTSGHQGNPELPPLCLILPPVAEAAQFLQTFFDSIGWADSGFVCSSHGVSNRRNPQGNRVPCEFAQVLSIVGPGQSLVADLASVPAHRSYLTRYLCVVATLDLRTVLVTAFARRLAEQDQAPTQSRPNWIYLTDRRRTE